MNDFGLLDPQFVEEVLHYFTGRMDIIRKVDTGKRTARGSLEESDSTIHSNIRCLVDTMVSDTPTGFSLTRDTKATIYQKRWQVLVPQLLEDVREGDFSKYEGIEYLIEHVDTESHRGFTRLELTKTTTEGQPLGA